MPTAKTPSKPSAYEVFLARLIAGERKFQMTRAEYEALAADPTIEPDQLADLQQMVTRTDILITDR